MTRRNPTAIMRNGDEGHAHCYKQGVRSVYGAELVAWECEHGKRGQTLPGGNVVARYRSPIMPDFADVLHSLVNDADVLDSGTFEEWARDLGYDPDSRK